MRAMVCLSVVAAACASAPQRSPSAGGEARFANAEQIIVVMPGDSLPRPVRYNRGPRYPTRQRGANVTGHLVAAFVVDAVGRVEYRSISFVQPGPHADFQQSVCDFLRQVQFFPARRDGVPQRALVFQPFGFSLSTAPVIPAVPDVKEYQTRASQMRREQLVADLEKRQHC